MGSKAQLGRASGLWQGLCVAGLTFGLAACSQELRLEGERLPVRAALDPAAPLDAGAAALGDDAGANRAAPIALAGAGRGDWTQTGGNAQHDMPHGALSSQPQLTMAVTIGGGNSKRSRIVADPVVGAGRAYALDSEGRVSAIGGNGGILWQADVRGEFDRGGNPAGGGLALAGGALIVATGYGEVLSLDAGTGAVSWRQRFDAPMGGAPLVAEGKAFVATRAGEVAAIELASGKLAWTNIATPGKRAMLRGASPVLAGQMVLYPSASGEVLAADAATGAAGWRAAVAGQDIGLAAAQFADITGSPVVKGGIVYAGSAGGRLVAFSALDGQRLWSANEGALGTPLVVGGSVFVVNQRAELVRLSAQDGSVIWRSEMPYFTKEKPRKRKAIHAHYGPVLAGGRVVVAGSDGLLRLFDPVSGALAGSAEIPGGAASSPVLAGGALYLLSGKGQLLAFR